MQLSNSAAAIIGLCLLTCLGQAQKPLAVIPFRFIKHEIVAQARINGQGPFTVLLDTGTAPSVVDLQIAQRIGLKVNSVGHHGSGGGTDEHPAYETTLNRVGFNGFATTEVAALATDLSGLSRQFGTPIDAVLGDSLFSGRVVQFDYPRQVVRLYARSPHVQKSRHSVTLRFRHEDGEVHLSGIKVNGIPVAANLDTGSNSAFSLTPRAIKRLGLSDVVAHAKGQKGSSFNGSFQSRSGTVESVQVGSIKVSSPKVGFWLPGTGHDDTPWDINIGNLFLQDFVVTVDYRESQVTLSKDP